jgi:hypothetical protein
MKKCTNKVNDFILKLYLLINDEKTNNIISWNKKGTSFIINDFEKFCYEILPKVYQTELYSSFHRQLNSYNFIKINNNKYEYEHPLFKKGNEDLLKDMKRKKKSNLNLINNDKIVYDIEELINQMKIIQKQINLLEGKQEFLSFCQNDLIQKNNELEERLYNVNLKEKKLENMFFELISFICPKFKFMEQFFKQFLIKSVKNKNEYFNIQLFINTFSQFVNNEISYYLLKQNTIFTFDDLE